MRDEVVKYHNDVHTASLRKFNAKELDIFMALMSRMREKEEDIVVFTFDYLKKLVDWTDDNEAFVRMLDSTYKKLIECNIKVGNDEEWTRFVLFQEYTISKKKSEISISIYSKFKFVLNILTSNFTRFELGEFVSLKSSYTKEFYRRMKQFKNTGLWRVSLEEFRRIMDIPDKYNINKIDAKVLAPIAEELGVKYKLKVVKLYKTYGRGRPSVCGFEFSFQKDSNDDEAQEIQNKTELQAFKKAQRDIKFYESRYSNRTIRVYDEKFDRFNYLKIRTVEYHPAEDSKVIVSVQNMDDGYENVLRFDSVRIWDGYFKKCMV